MVSIERTISGESSGPPNAPGGFGDYIDGPSPPTWSGAMHGQHREQQCPRQQPGFFNVKAPYPPSLCLCRGRLSKPAYDYDSPAPGELTFSFGGGTQKSGDQLKKQIITFGENANNGFLVSEKVELLPDHIKVPFFALPRCRMGNTLAIEFVGRELDESSSDEWRTMGGSSAQHWSVLSGVSRGLTWL